MGPALRSNRFTYVSRLYEPTAVRDRNFFANRRAERSTVGKDVWIAMPPYPARRECRHALHCGQRGRQP